MTPKESEFTSPVISIGTAAEKLGLSIPAIRKYEKEGLIIAFRTESNYRLFSFEDIERIKIIKHMIREIGLNFEGIRRLQALIPCWKQLRCTKKRRNNCPGYIDSTKPCWMIGNLDCPEVGNKCRECIVYRQGFQNIQRIKQVVYE